MTTDQAIANSYQQGNTLIACAKKHGVGVMAVYSALDRNGVEVRPQGRIKLNGYASKRDRDAALIEMRARGETYESVGQAFGLTRERVRQVLAQHAPHLCYRQNRQVTLECQVCGEEFVVCQSRVKERKCCSRKCAGVNLRGTHPKTLAVVEESLRMRADGHVWWQIAAKTGSANPQSDINRWAKASGADVSWLKARPITIPAGFMEEHFNGRS